MCDNFYYSLGDLVREKVIRGKLLIDWRHTSIKEIVANHYQFSQDNIKGTHTELADFYFEEFCDKDDESEEGDAPGVYYSFSNNIEHLNI